MNRTVWVTLALAALLAGCVSGSKDRGDVRVEALPEGSYTISVGDETDPTVGKYYLAGDRGYLVLDGKNGRAQRIYRRNRERWAAIPRESPDSVTLLNSSATAARRVVSPAELAATYVTRTASGEVVTFTIDQDGAVTTSSGGCRLSGEVKAGVLPGTADITLRTHLCDLPDESTGVLLVDPDYSPAAFRLLADDGATLVELWAYQE